MSDLVVIAGLAVLSCLLVGLFGAVVLHLTRRRSLRYQVMTAALLPVVAVAASVLVNVRLMFLSAHDSTVVLISLIVSLVLAVAGAWWVRRRIISAAQELGVGLGQLVADSSVARGTAATESGGSTAPAELANVVADLQRTRQTLAESRARERAAEDARRELVVFMSHDLRTPLAGLRALTEALEDGVISDVPRALGHLRGTVSRMAGLVDDLFALSRVQGQGEPKAATLVSLTELLTDVASEQAATARQRGVHLAVEVPDADPLAVLGSADDLGRAMVNLVANAVRHTDSGQTVRMAGGRAADGHVQVSVEDSCGGIPPEHLNRVFDTGWRGSPSRSGDDGGAGLGLAITRGVVESHAGRIGVRNFGAGCRFEVDLPACAAR